MDKNTRFSSFEQWLDPINFRKLEQKLNQTHADKYVKKLTTKAYILLFLYAQLHEEDSLRALSDCLLNKSLQKATGLSSISAAQLSRKNNSVDPQLLMMIFLELVAKMKGKQAPDSGRLLKIVDSTTITMNLKQFPWAHFKKTKAGVKLHLRLVFMGKGQVFPEKALLTSAQIHDRAELDDLVDEEAMYVFDRGYIDYKAFDRFFDNGMFFASRLKKNAVTHCVREYDVPKSGAIQSDQMVLLGDPIHQAENFYRLIVSQDDQGRTIRIITNRFDLPAEEIGMIYRECWAIELFFKWLKQHVRLKTFYGQSETAVHNQIILSLIHYCLFVLIQQKLKTDASLLQMSRWLKGMLWVSAKRWLHRLQFQARKKSVKT